MRQPVVYILLFALTLLVAFALRYPSLYEPRWYGDEGIFAAIAQNMRDGRSLYGEAWDNKPPFIFLTYAGTQSAFGTSVFALHAVATASVLLTQGVLALIVWRIFGPGRAVAAAAIFALVMGTPLIEGNLAMTETFMILPSSLAVLAFVLATEQRRHGPALALYALAGVMVGIAAGYKQVAVFDGAAIALMIALTQARPLRPIAALACGFLLPQGALAITFLAAGSFPEYWYAIGGSLPLYSSLDPVNPFVRAIGFLPAVLTTAWLLRRRDMGEPVTLRQFPMLWLSFAIAGAMSSAFPFPHYLQQAAPAFAAAVVSAPLVMDRDGLSRAFVGVTCVLMLAAVAGQFSDAYRERKQLRPVAYYDAFLDRRMGRMSELDYEYRFDGASVAVNDIVALMKQDNAGTSLYTWGELPWIYAAGGYTNPTRYYTSFLGEIVPGAKPEIIRDLDAHPPVYVLVSDDSYAPFLELDEFLRGRYALLHQENDWRLYRLTTAAGELTPDNPANATTPG